MLDIETSPQLQAAVLRRLNNVLPNESETDELIRSFVRLTTLTAVITLEEYEKMNQ